MSFGRADAALVVAETAILSDAVATALGNRIITDADIENGIAWTRRIAGVKGILAVGTDLFHIFAKAIMGTAVHRKLGNVSTKLAIAFLVGSGLGTVIGGSVNKALYDINPLLSDTFISVIYSVLLGFLGFYGLFDFIRSS